MTMKVCCLSDLHGNLPDVPDCDILLLAGDYCHNHRDLFWYNKNFRVWLSDLSERMVVFGVAGNHDFYFERHPDHAATFPWRYLQDGSVEESRGLRIYGSPWQPRFHDWAFNLDEHELAKKWADIPDDTDILILHGPPHGIGDLARDERGMPVHVGSPSLAKRIEEIRTRLVVFGHIHAGYGVYKSGRTTYVNASHCDERYRPVNAPILLTFDMNDFARDAE